MGPRWVLQIPDQLVEAAVIDSGTKVSTMRLKNKLRLRRPGLAEPLPEGVVEDGLERSFGLAGDIGETRCEVVLQRHCGAHVVIMMPWDRAVKMSTVVRAIESILAGRPHPRAAGPSYSLRKACIGSTDAARKAGR
jgi:hypothetical protein